VGLAPRLLDRMPFGSKDIDEVHELGEGKTTGCASLVAALAEVHASDALVAILVLPVHRHHLGC